MKLRRKRGEGSTKAAGPEGTATPCLWQKETQAAQPSEHMGCANAPWWLVTTLIAISERLQGMWDSEQRNVFGSHAGGGRALSDCPAPSPAGKQLFESWKQAVLYQTHGGFHPANGPLQKPKLEPLPFKQQLPVAVFSFTVFLPWRSSPVTAAGSLSLPPSCFQPVLNPPGNLTLPRRRVLLYVISRQQLWPWHPEKGPLCRVVVSGMNFPSAPPHLFRGCWKHTVGLCTSTASRDFCRQLWGACPFALVAGYPQNLHNHLLFYFLFCILRDWTSHLPTEGALVFCSRSSRLWQYYWKVTLSIFNIQKCRTAVLSHTPFIHEWLRDNNKFKAAKARIWTAWKKCLFFCLLFCFFLFLYFILVLKTDNPTNTSQESNRCYLKAEEFEPCNTHGRLISLLAHTAFISLTQDKLT